MMAKQDNAAEETAAQIIVRVLGGRFEINDTGSRPGQYDVRIIAADQRVIALEITSFGGDPWKETSAGIERARRNREHTGEGLRDLWQVSVPSGISIRS